MKTDEELEHLMRATFAGRAKTVDQAPAWSGDPGLPSIDPPPTSRLRRWMPALAAAAAVIVIATSVIVLRSGPGKRSPISPGLCSTTLPEAWVTALNSAVVPAGGLTARPTSITADGAVIAVRDDGVTPGSPRRIVELRRGAEPKILYTVPNPDNRYVLNAELIGAKWLLVDISNEPTRLRDFPDSRGDSLDEVLLINLDSGEARDLATTPRVGGGNTYLDGGLVLNDNVYWAVATEGDGGGGPPAPVPVTVHAYDPETGTTTTVYSGTDFTLGINAAGLLAEGQNDSVRVIVPAPLPAPVAAAVGSSPRRLGTDGTSYAWTIDDGTVAYWRPGMAVPMHVRIPSVGAIGSPLAVAGDVIGLDNGILDMRTDAYAPIPSNAIPGLVDSGLYFGALNVLAGFGSEPRGNDFVDGYYEGRPQRVLILDIHGLPPLAC